MNQQELLNELDTYLALREDPEFVTTKTLSNGYTLTKYLVRGAETLLNDVVHYPIIGYWVYREGEPQELAYYDSDPIEAFFRNKVRDYIEVTQGWVGTIFRSARPKAICRVLETALEGEKWVLITETAPDTYSVEDITGEIIVEI